MPTEGWYSLILIDSSNWIIHQNETTLLVEEFEEIKANQLISCLKELNNNFESNLKLKEQTDEFNKSCLNTGPSRYDHIKLLQEKDK